MRERNCSEIEAVYAIAEKHEKAERAAIMRERKCSEIEAVYVIAERIGESCRS